MQGSTRCTRGVRPQRPGPLPTHSFALTFHLSFCSLLACSRKTFFFVAPFSWQLSVSLSASCLAAHQALLVATTVQVCSYRVLASYECDELTNFSRCILERHNCLRNSASIPTEPAPPPLASFRGQPLTFEATEDLFIGHLASGGQPFSWRVAAGKNPGAPSSFLHVLYMCEVCKKDTAGGPPRPACRAPAEHHASTQAHRESAGMHSGRRQPWRNHQQAQHDCALQHGTPSRPAG